MKQQYSDETLIALFLSTREDRLFTQLYQRYYDKVYASALRLMGDREEARDQTQEIFCKVHDRLHTFRGESSFATWLFVLTRYHCFSARDRLKKQVYIPLEPGHEFIHHDNQEELTLEERWQQAEAALQGLTHRDREMLHKHYVVRESVATLASEGQLSESAVKMRLKRARDQAKQLHKHIVLHLN
ncbi:RNA polymerase sigma factor [Fibrella forsythiae]|uniref:Sigma-70 family RNA polymerase sigma factor n=1 Tax=Fibrella forsythiae TaxID=2817061 RepID=A0ABS3JUL8_9BACT|nr:sigma-70 family RNA polymerase sigma factor [Fibrella forsythiae]MBO0953143.1 sigma-70 family RNA polymerase sigma factor [Fibrella forsythiae]